jgi:hypothetical protein
MTKPQKTKGLKPGGPICLCRGLYLLHKLPLYIQSDADKAFALYRLGKNLFEYSVLWKINLKRRFFSTFNLKLIEINVDEKNVCTVQIIGCIDF